MNKMLVLGLLIGIVSIGMFGIQSIFAQENGDTNEGLEFATGDAGIVLLLGVGAGFLTAYQGYRTTNKDFDTLKFFDGVIMAVLGAVPLAIGAAMTQTNMGIFEYVMIFFAALGIGNQITKTRAKTVPSNEGV